MGLGLSCTATLLWAAPMTQNFIALRSEPLYQNAAAMPYANANAPKGGMLSQAAVLATFDNFNTLNGKGTPAEGVGMLYDTLMSASLDEPTVRYPLLAERVTQDPQDRSYVIYHLNPKARFSNGQPVLAADVVYSFNELLSKGAPGIRVYLGDIKSVTATDAHTVRFDFKTKDNAEMAMIVTEVPIYSKQDGLKRDYTRVTMQAPLGSGPYVVERIDAGRSITYKRNPDYWGRDLPVNRGRYNFAQMKYVYFRNGDIAFEGFKAGQYFYHEENMARRWTVRYDFPAITQKMVVKERIAHQNPVNIQSFVFNNRRPQFADIRVRRALTYAYDYEWMNKALFYGEYQRLQSFFHNSELAATGTPSPQEMKLLTPLLPQLSPLQRAGVLTDWQYPRTDGSGFNRKNLLIARQLLLQAGYRYQGETLVDAQGKPFEFEFLIRQEGLQRTIMPFIRNLKRLGITVNLRMVDAPQYVERMRRFDFDMATGINAPSLSPGNEQAQYWGSTSADQEGNYNLAGVKNPAIDQAIDRIVRANDRPQLIDATRVLDRLLRSGYYVIPTYSKAQYWIAYWNMYDRPKRAPKYDIGLDYWWVDQPKAQRVTRYLQQNQR